MDVKFKSALLCDEILKFSAACEEQNLRAAHLRRAVNLKPGKPHAGPRAKAKQARGFKALKF
ncbi:hypothetical protein [uncultured Campylobacter sp.]|uniref:hypothetical protein n=1 Tax=uncultured Campylobacter sp. TaxID=218934 RepID=UPI00262369AC|nr:hypothetical protein [uncultured Campylobacter sp.]